MSTILKDIRYVSRMLAKSPGFALVAIATLGLGIGVNSTVFSVVNAYLFRPLPVKEPNQLVAIASKNRQFDFPFNLSYPNYKDVLERTDVFSDTIGFDGEVVNMSVGGHPERVWVELVLTVLEGRSHRLAQFLSWQAGR